MSATLADYQWWQSFRPDWSDAHCVTLISDTTSPQVIDALGGRTVAHAPGVDALMTRSFEHWGDTHDSETAIIGVTDIGAGWALIAEVNGYLGVTPELIAPVSAGRTVVSHFRNVNAVYRFNWWRDGQLLTDLDLLFPAERFGAEPDALTADIAGVGIPLDDEDVSSVDLSAAAFALAERITGVACTAELFERAAFTVATVPMPGG